MDVFKNKKLSDKEKILLIVAVLLIIVLLKKFDINEELQTALGIVSLLAGYIGSKIHKKSKADDSKEQTEQEHPISPAVAILYIIGFMQLSQRVVSWLVATALGSVNISTEPTTSSIFSISVITLYMSAVLIIPLTIFIAHRLKKHVLIWIFTALYLNQVITILLTLLFYRSVFTEVLKVEPVHIYVLNNLVINIGILIPGALAGYLWARKTQDIFTLGQLFSKVSKEDQQKLLQTARSLPPASEQSNKST